MGVRALEEAGIKAPFVIDTCASPGGKALAVADHFPEGTILARDISEEKIRLIRENAARCKAINLKAEVFDATAPDGENKGRADLVIADLPCSGIGVIGNKPDIKNRLKEEDIPSLAALQRTILSSVQSLVKKGGFLVFSTCTVTKEENDENASWFRETFDFEEIKREQLLPCDGSDGFFIAVFKKN